ncbi:hypothetical protein BKA70DRAFT_1266024 [Coprinopsis sp. MPI-PUGE-AT-0042]|nr:hypothetical protein BKA70DRAFT_1266024 [Coprinopsis sp. MPI-PUGE-AT-0042]
MRAHTPQDFDTDESHGKAYKNMYRSAQQHDASLLALRGPFATTNELSLRSEPTSSNGNNRPSDYSDSTHWSAAGDHDRTDIVLAHTETHGGSWKDHAHSSSPPFETLEELVESGRSTPTFTDQLSEIVAAATASTSLCLYPSGIAEPHLASPDDRCLSSTGDSRLDLFFGISSSSSVAEEASHLANQSEVSGKVVAVFKVSRYQEACSMLQAMISIFIRRINRFITIPPNPSLFRLSPQQKGPGKDLKDIWQTALVYAGLGVAIGIIPTAILKWVGRQWC